VTQSLQQEPSIADSFASARALQQAGDLSAAKRQLGRILIVEPHHAEALTMLASIAYQQGEDTQAEAYLDRAIEIYQSVVAQLPDALAARAPLVNLLLARGRPVEAEQHVRGLMLPLNPMRASPQDFVARRRRGIERGLPAMLINTVPKSASESIWNQVAESLGLAQSHLSLGLFPDCCLVPARLRSAAEGGLIAKEHIPASAHNLAALAAHGQGKVVLHLRDLRQATLSWAHFVETDVSMRLMAPIWRKIVPPAGVLGRDLPTLLDWCLEHYLPLLVGFVRGWMDAAARRPEGLAVLFLTFEQFRTEPQRYFEAVLDFYGIDRGLFAADAKAEVVHLRKGELEEWRTVFSPAQQARAWAAIPGDMAEAFDWRR